MINLVRWSLTIALVIGVYGETGKFTAISMFLVFLALEFQAVINKRGK